MQNTPEELQLKLVTETGLKKLYIAERDGLRRVLAELDTRVHTGYDFNADPDSMTALVGAALRGERFPNAWSSDSARWKHFPKPCPTCHGRGVDLFESADGDENDCPDCNGQGTQKQATL